MQKCKKYSMANNKSSYISVELFWLEKKISELQQAVDNYSLEKLEDRYGPRAMPNGKIVDALVSSKEDQLKTVAFIMEKLPKMLQGLDDLREKEDKRKALTKGDVEVSFMMNKEENEQ